MFEIKTREVPTGRLMSIQRRQHGDQTEAFVAEAKAAFAAHLGPVAPIGPFTLIFHGPLNDQADGPIEGCNRRAGTDWPDRTDRHPHRARAHRGVRQNHQAPVGLPRDPRRLRRSRVLSPSDRPTGIASHAARST